VHNIIVSADSYFYPLLHQETGLAVLVINLVLIQIDSYFYTSLLGFCEREGYFLIGEYVHSYIDDGFGLIDIFNDGFLRVVRKGEVDFGFGKWDKKKLGDKNYS